MTTAPDSEPRHPDLVDRFRAAVRRHPGRTAVCGPDGTLDFAALDRESARLAAALAARGVGPGDRVAVSVPRGCALVSALLGVWRAGAAYVPLDGGYPAERLEFMAGEAGITAVIGGPADGRAAPGGAWVLDPAADEGPTAPGADAAPGPGDPAYVIFTSGSSGRPKGVEVTRSAVASLYAALEEAEVFEGPPAVVGWNASVSFDASVPQWARVCRGDTVVVIGEDDRKDPDRLAALLDEHAVTDLDLTPSHWELLRDRLLGPRPDGRRLRLLMGGEPVPAPVWRELADAGGQGGPQALNLYGPTECTVEVARARFAGRDPHLGEALPGSRLHVLDGTLRETAPGEEGELYVGGGRLAVGYVNRPGLTAERFVADPFGPPGARIYRTGDRVRRTGAGLLEFLGRADRQVKLRGFRVELAEVEAALAACPEVSSAVVLHDRGPAGDRLIGYVVPARAAGDRLRERLAQLLPEHMLPADVVGLDALPLNPNGKLDPGALPRPERVPSGGPAGSRPLGPVEELIAEVWTEVLGREGVTADSDFFALGGHSLLALRVVGRLKRERGVLIATKDVYRYPRLRDLAAHVTGLANAAPGGPTGREPGR
ncbi:hypothetical protein GCM10023235_06500 [Kitasatospora terrestris]|uniref:Carrier domain-containing protein n=2 Tax=Kitasatospora terrestris TaxID=258051 RepID=A0ABP9D8Y8_9ACTN